MRRVMLRDLDQKGGTGVYTRHLMEALLRLYTENDYNSSCDLRCCFRGDGGRPRGMTFGPRPQTTE
jgi:hypothetical protein